MAEELKKDGLENVVENNTPEPKELTEIEKRAMADGWVPQDQWDGDPESWRPAKEFVDRGELIRKIEDQGRTLKELRRALSDFGRHHAAVRDVEFQRAYNMLKAQKKEALELGEADKVIDIDEKMQAVRDAQRNSAQQPVVQLPDVPEENPVFSNWVDRNSWYKHNSAMRAYADRLGNELGARGGISPTDLLSKVEAEVKKEFAHKFNNPKRDAPGAVEGSTNKGTSGGKRDDITLTDEERRVAERFIRTIPGYTMEKYKADLKKVKGV